MRTIRFEDHGQDFLEWDIERNEVVGCRPRQAWVWLGWTIVGRLEVGKKVTIRNGDASTERLGLKNPIVAIQYPITKITRKRKVVTA